MKIGTPGSGYVAKSLAAGFIKHGHEVTLSTRTTGKLSEWTAKNSRGHEASFADAARIGE